MTEAVLMADEVARGSWKDYLQLTKPRIVLMIVMTTIAGYCLASPQPFNPILLLNTILGTALVAGGTNALNQWAERDLDKKMNRTRMRPLPDGRISGRGAFIFSSLVAIIGVVYLALLVHWLPALLSAITLVTYLFVYTPLKRVSTLCTIVGSFPGAIPPVIGWAAVRHDLALPALLAFAIMFVWQLPHFMAIGWLYREDYARAGYEMVAVHDSDGRKSGRQAVGYTLLLIGLSILPVVYKVSGFGYLAGAVIGGLFLLLASWTFLRQRTRMSARKLFIASNVYLPVVMLLLVANRLI
jgi:protoheme IX farnesyltransferase